MMCKIENCYCKSPISYPKDCYDDSVEDKDKILVSKDFIEKELDALIDVSKENIANKDIDANY